ncbi:MAG: hypothetical protein ACRCXT_20110 [Paraclostridium sp.]
MQKEFLTKEKIFIQTTKFADLLLNSDSYSSLHDNIAASGVEYMDTKVYDVAPSGFVDFNQHLYENINEMNSISCGLFLEMSVVTFRVFIWSSKGEGFEIFKHILRKEEIEVLNTVNDIKGYIHLHMGELEEGIVKTYNEDEKLAFENFGRGIENRQLPLSSLLQFMTIENNINDFR